MTDIKGNTFETRTNCFAECKNYTDECQKLANEINEVLEKNYKGKSEEVIVHLKYCSKWEHIGTDMGD